MDALSLIEEHLKGQPSKPPLHLWNPELCGEIDIVIRANGDWMHEGSKIERLSLVKLFASILRREADENYYLVTPVEKWLLQVEEEPLQIIAMDVLAAGSDEQQIIFTTNVDEKVLLGADHVLTVSQRTGSEEPVPVVSLDHHLTAKLNRAVFYRLVDCAVERGKVFSVLSEGCWFEIGA